MPRRNRIGLFGWLGLGVLVLVLLAAATSTFTMGTDGLWRDPYHDRNTHFLNGLKLAQSIAALDPLGYFAHAVAIPVWPPLHAIVLGFVLLVGGPNPDLGIVPSLLGWIGTITMTAVLAFRATSDGSRLLAATLAAAFAAWSPAFRLLGSDVMLEALGALLSALVLYAYQRASDAWATNDTRAAARYCRYLAISLSLLFLEKYNYWLMALAAVTVTALLNGELTAFLRRLTGPDGRALLRALLLHPFLPLAAALVGMAAWLSAREATAIQFAGRDFLIAPGLVLMLAWSVILARLALFWLTNHAAVSALLGRHGLIIAAWHGLVVGLWFLVPEVLRSFAWFVGPTHFGASHGYDPGAALLFHWHGFSEGFHSHPALALAALCLAVVGGSLLVARKGGVRVLAVFAALSALIVVLHPQQQWRFQATWLFAVWALAGVGAAEVWRVAARRVSSPAVRSGLTLVVAAAFVAALGITSLKPPSEMALKVAIRTPERPNDRDLAAAYLPLVQHENDIGFASTLGVSDLFAWTVMVACRCFPRIDQPVLQELPDRAAVRAAGGAWLAANWAGRIVFVDTPAPYVVPGLPNRRERLLGVHDALVDQERYRPVAGGDVAIGPSRIAVWELTSAALATPRPAPPARHHLITLFTIIVALAVLSAVMIPGTREPPAT